MKKLLCVCNIKLVLKGYAPCSTLVLVGVKPEHFTLRPQEAAPEQGVNGYGGAKATQPGRDGSLHKAVEKYLDVIDTNSKIPLVGKYYMEVFINALIA